MTKTQKKEIVRRIKAGQSRASIAAHMGFSKGYLREIWKSYQLLGDAMFTPAKRKLKNRLPGKLTLPTASEQKKIRRLWESQDEPLTFQAFKDLIKKELGLTVGRRHLIGLVEKWQLSLAPTPPPPGMRPVLSQEVEGILRKESSLRSKLNATLTAKDKAEWQILGLPRGDRRDGPGPQWRKRQNDQSKRSYFFLELWTAGPEFLLSPESRELLQKKIYFYSNSLGVDVLSFVIMDSHCFLLVTLPPRQKYLDKLRDPQKLLARAKSLYLPAQYRRMEQLFATTEDPEQLLDYYLRDFCNLSSFVKMIKESVSRAHNLHQNNAGSIWAERYRSLNIPSEAQLLDYHLRINRWPATRGLVAADELEVYPWASFPDLVESSKRAIKGTCRALGIPVTAWKKPYPGDQKKGRKRLARNWFLSQVRETVE